MYILYKFWSSFSNLPVHEFDLLFFKLQAIIQKKGQQQAAEKTPKVVPTKIQERVSITSIWN